MQDQTNCGKPSIRFVSLVSILLAANLFALSHAIPSERTAESPRSPLSHKTEPSEAPSLPVFNPVRPQRLEETYYPITPGESLRWFLTSTIGPAHMAGVAFVSAGGTAVNRPVEYGTHWEGWANRFGMGIAGSATSNAMEAGVGLLLREVRATFVCRNKPSVRVGNVARLTFLARNESGKSEPAYARYLGIVGSNFLSNTWRVPREANAQDALLRSSEAFAGRMAANAFSEFWPDVKNLLRHNRRRFARLNIEPQTETSLTSSRRLAGFVNSPKDRHSRSSLAKCFQDFALAFNLPKEERS
jgi:hypothetical protein